MKKILQQIDNYYTKKNILYGNTPQGVDWNSSESQQVRFGVLSKIINSEKEFSILDYGCGFGGLYIFLNDKFDNFSYTGFDISGKMIEDASALYQNSNRLEWTTNIPNKAHDYVIASGIFNVKLENDQQEWIKYILSTLSTINNLAKKGFSFNILTSYSDKKYMKDYLYYADPLFLFDYCKINFSKNIALLHDYDLYEFTILIRK